MDEQPIPACDPWPWDEKSRQQRSAGPTFGSLRVLEGVRECCTQCGEMIFPDEIAYLIDSRVGQKWLELHFHVRCYVTWERSAGNQRELELRT